jgi:hypothetical protein
LRGESVALDGNRLGKSLKETDITKAIKDVLKHSGAFPIKIAGGPFQHDISDLLVCFEGKFVSIEVKRPGGKLTDGQERFLHNVRAAGGIAFVAHSVDDVVRELDLDVKLYPMFARGKR